MTEPLLVHLYHPCFSLISMAGLDRLAVITLIKQSPGGRKALEHAGTMLCPLTVTSFLVRITIPFIALGLRNTSPGSIRTRLSDQSPSILYHTSTTSHTCLPTRFTIRTPLSNLLYPLSAIDYTPYHVTRELGPSNRKARRSPLPSGHRQHYICCLCSRGRGTVQDGYGHSAYRGSSAKP